MIAGIGTDMVSIDRIADLISRYGDRFIQRCFTPSEIRHCQQRGLGRRASSFAKIFAAKEAVLKACGTGMREGISWQDIEISHDPLGKPLVQLTGGVYKTMNTYVASKLPQHLKTDQSHFQIDLSLTDEQSFAMAFAVVSYI